MGGAAALLVLAVVILGGGGGSPGRVARRRPALLALLPRVAVLAGTGPQSFAVDEQRAQSDAVSRTLQLMPYVRVAGAQHREIALTFDDGPGPYTPQVVDILRREGVPGTFFEVGSQEYYFHDGTSDIVQAGFPIGDHTEKHVPMDQLSARDQKAQLLQDATSIGRYGAPFPRLFRPPYGVWNNTTLSLLRKYHMLMVLWTVDTDDYERPGTEQIIESAVRGARPGAIILLHDAGGDRSETVAALPVIIRDLELRGYRLVSVPQLLLDNPAPRDQDIEGLTGVGGG